MKTLLRTVCLLAVTGLALPAWAADPRDLELPPPRISGGMPLMEALSDRHSSRSFSPEPLPQQMLADLLWAAWGVNRPGSGKRTAPSAVNRQEITVYVVMEQGAYRYDAPANRLAGVESGDLRELTGTQGFVATAPLNLVYVADMGRVAGGNEERKILYAGADTGFISQNVYLFCASKGLATVVRGAVDREPLARALGLGSDQQVILAQTVGYPAQ